MLILRHLRWPDDRPAILALDLSFTTERVYRVVSTANTFTLREETLSPPLHKVYNLTDDVEHFPTFDRVFIAEHDQRVVGVGALSHDTVDERALVRHLYLDRAYRGQGIGRALMEAMLAQAEQWPVRYAWLETQDVNYAAVQFYQRLGFQWCGLDLSLDEHDGSSTDETAIFLMRRLK